MKRRFVRVGGLLLVALLACALASFAASLPPSLSLDTAFAPPSGLAEDDFGSSTDVAAGMFNGNRVAFTVG